MLNRRHLRIKVLQILYAYFQTEDKDPLQVEKELFRSIDKMYELYIYFLLTFEEMVQFAETRIEDKKNKIQPTSEDLDPNRKFVDNPYFRYFASNAELKRHSETMKINWGGAVKNDLMRKMFVQIKDSDLYNDYMKSRETNDEDDRQFALSLFKSEIANFELLHDFFENESIYWMDDIDLICSMVLKTIKAIEPSDFSVNAILPLYKDEEDEKGFIKAMVRKTLEKDDENTKTIDELTQNWELDRIAKMDVILLKMALTELTELPSIPKKVTLNEYIEISKYYSTPKSQVFINGILDKAVEKLDKEGKLIKTGRGLIN
ncbi:transcription antitermination factor NusB [Paracrocinitomix mangrovi]|uniref:transcription antitermination factor NusB n=1 Tax=Paracrocinitomix mangrovi TaxID=2862509 RepID=UPI001C8E9C0B|nr:transcription antitermination factor NusB [Paracrocinitomix mangrovi]UKN02106.1 transcription antitermination factor NusB [Paracrocinitomix mangrovi]